MVGLWVACIVVVCAAAYKLARGRKPERIVVPYKLGIDAPAGTLCVGGSEATSKIEKRIRDDLIRSGFRLYPQGTALITHPDEFGKKHRYTPDIIVKGYDVIVEVDPEYTHLGKEYDDDRRGRMYRKAGFAVVRFRLGPHMRPLGKYDLVRAHKDYNPRVDLPMLVSLIRRAKPN